MQLGYARVSKADDQDTAAQVSALKAAGCTRVYEEKASGGRWDRPQLHRMLDQLREGDVIVVWKLDRLSRSLKDFLHILEKIDAAAANFRSLTEAIDTSGPAGRMMMQMLGSFAEFERAMVRERTRAGLKAAREQGRKGGRRSKLMPRQRAEILAASPPRREPRRPKQGRLLKLSRWRPLRSPCCRKADSLAISMGCNRPSGSIQKLGG